MDTDTEKGQPTRVLVCGDRNWRDYDAVKNRLAQLPLTTTIIEGGASGADRLAKYAAIELGMGRIEFPADWGKHGRAAGPIRNTQMLKEGRPDLVIAFHPDLSKSKGTKNMIEQARRAGIPVEVLP